MRSTRKDPTVTVSKIAKKERKKGKEIRERDRSNFPTTLSAARAQIRGVSQQRAVREGLFFRLHDRKREKKTRKIKNKGEGEGGEERRIWGGYARTFMYH